MIDLFVEEASDSYVGKFANISLGVPIFMLLSFISCFQDSGMAFMRALYSNCKFPLDPICCFYLFKINELTIDPEVLYIQQPCFTPSYKE